MGAHYQVVNEKVRAFLNECKPYFKPRELGMDLVRITVLSSISDLVGGGIDNPLPNIATGSGILGGHNEISLLEEAKVSKRWEYRRGFVRTLGVASLATIVQMYAGDNIGVTDYLIDIFSNTARYVAGFTIGGVYAALSNHIDDQDDGPPRDEPPNPEPEPSGASNRDVYKWLKIPRPKTKPKIKA